MVNPAVFGSLSARHGPYEVDLFASHSNHQVPIYYSWHNTPDTTGVDAFRFKWGRRCWCNPPFRLIGKVWRICTPVWRAPYPGGPLLAQRYVVAHTHGLLSEEVQAVELLPNAPDLFLPGSAGNKVHRKTPPWHIMALVVDFAAPAAAGTTRVRIPAALQQQRRG
jgi:hypothetical protein